jgi:uncharacterized protein YegJ (DUF2314 family)
MKWRLGNGEESHRRAPATFKIPPVVRRHNLKAGQSAKLMFEQDSNTERMWVKIVEVANGRYIGALDSHPSFITVSFGERIEFNPEHVIAVAP